MDNTGEVRYQRSYRLKVLGSHIEVAEFCDGEVTLYHVPCELLQATIEILEERFANRKP